MLPFALAVDQAIERWADSAAAQEVGDPAIVAHALGLAALARPRFPPQALSAARNDALERILDLFEPPRRRAPNRGGVSSRFSNVLGARPSWSSTPMALSNSPKPHAGNQAESGLANRIRSRVDERTVPQSPTACLPPKDAPSPAGTATSGTCAEPRPSYAARSRLIGRSSSASITRSCTCRSSPEPSPKAQQTGRLGRQQRDADFAVPLDLLDHQCRVRQPWRPLKWHEVLHCRWWRFHQER